MRLASPSTWLAPARDALTSPARRGAVWTAVGFGGGQVLRFGGNVIVARLLTGEDFGVTALVGAILQGVTLFSDIGIGPSIIQSQRGEERSYLSTAWSIQVVRGILIWLVVCALAIPLGKFYDEPKLAIVAPVGALSLLVASLASTKLFVAQKHLDLKRLTLVDLASQVVAVGVQVVWAYCDGSVWALVGGGLAGSVTKTILSHVTLSGEGDRFGWDREAAGALVRFGKWIFFSTVLTYCVTQADKLVFGKLVPLGSVGDYSIGSQIALLPAMGIGALSLGVAFPHYSRLFHARVALAETFHRTRSRLLVLSGWMCAGLMAGGPAAVKLLYPARYHDAGWIVQLLAAGSWFFVLESTNGAVLLACDRARWVAYSNGAKLLGMVVLIPLGFRYAGFPGAVAGYAASDVLKWITSAAGVARLELSAWPRDLLYTGAVACVTAVSIWTMEHLASTWTMDYLGLEDLGRVWPAILVFVLVTLFYLPLAVFEFARIRKRASA